MTPHLRARDTVLDIGCGPALVTWHLGMRHRGPILAVDIVDSRIKPTSHFALYNGIHLPFEDDSIDVAMLNFVLHHVPNDTKPAVLAEVHRVVRHRVIVMEDTPRNFMDRIFNRRHGETFRRSIGSTAGFGFFNQAEWELVFNDHGFVVKQSIAIGRFARDWKQPYARSCFVLEKSTPRPDVAVRARFAERAASASHVEEPRA
ncbi:MAG: class I SAM-dependent methyltransferase [Deltaproteobacteria bacterium]|nr:class I SAM-dependent methyltransferase [Deltaproteobacteria bacterium]MDQ3295259.1 class I SAM-dependent methyltransferase [Myxococcota bacterium]